MKKNKLMEECRKMVTPEIKRENELSFYISNIMHNKLNEIDMSEKKFLELTNISEDMFVKWLSGAYNFKISDIVKIEIALNIKIINI